MEAILTAMTMGGILAVHAPERPGKASCFACAPHRTRIVQQAERFMAVSSQIEPRRSAR
jgi:hypothetical protein